MAIRKIVSRLGRLLPLAAVAGLLLVALFLVASVEQESSRLGTLSLLILSLTALALLVLVVAIGLRLHTLLRELRRREPGARLRARLVGVFIALSLPPVVILYLFSVEFLNETIDGWFDTGAEPALADAIELGQLFLDLETRRARDELNRIAARMPPGDDNAQLEYLFRNISRSGPVELSVLNPAGAVETLVHVDPQRLVADLPSAFALSQAVSGGEYSAAEAGDEGLRIRALTPLSSLPGQPQRVLQGIFPTPEGFTDLATSVEQAYFRFENASFLRQRLQQSLALILSLVLGMTALLAILLAFNASRRLVRPIRDLARATETMRAGELPDTLSVQSRDELGFLVESFNSMATQLHRAGRELESQRRWLETLLGRLSAGVIAFDGGRRLTTANQGASEILGLDLEPLRGKSLETLERELPGFEPLLELLRRRMRESGTTWREEIRLERPDQTLALVCRGSTLPDPEHPDRFGHVVVFDDVTMLDQAQRQAAWAELARRLAHEIKNPLTPIRLAAERMQAKLGDGLDPDRARVLERATTTIISQVDGLRRMVDAFGDYARPGQTRREPLEVNQLIGGIVDLWTAGDSGIRFETRLTELRRRPVGDPGQLQQILNNLVQNAREAHPENRPRLEIETRVEGDGDPPVLCIEINDDGPGFDPSILPRVFEPYASTKPRGTGLGLAIVQRIVDQMGGQIEASNRDAGGARIRITLPLTAAPADAGNAP